MKREIKISDFLKTGKFGTVEINDSIKTVIEKLGEPDGNINVSKPNKGIHYSMYELIFSNDKLESIQNDRFDPKYPELTEFENDKFKLNSEFLKADRIQRLGEIESELDKLNIEYNIIDYCDRKAIKTIGNVVIDFNDEVWSDNQNGFVKIENVKDYVLIGIRYYPNNE
ncbi:hypothetical protein GCM10011344_34550 [Dokdonia pacifica]|uniref:Uncharacterized protein n=1 Tax=Dokdonia pacifica TaxID=1627892 RepID=A0A239ANG9_9FLAO|nr:hypothetical protein [Dokdonia pacifica]GGG30704.1 hypothetical protein GCM10011344_34550 [Dokdonia pacifica]SNR96594.1 hypothetical protein SAMN06265376_1051 [Dokdonia pacifica]